jgi:2-phosphoglycerate kinase
MIKHPWQVLLIGGSSGTGKTRLAREFSRATGVSVVQVDDIRLSLQACTSPATHPELHRFVGPASADALASPESVVAGYQTVADAVEPAVRAVMSHHIDVDDSGPIILEGDGVRPRLGSLEYLRGSDSWFERVPAGLVQALFLVEDDLEQLKVNMFGRRRGTGDEPDQRDVSRNQMAQGSWEFGQHLKSEAASYSVPVVNARPFERLFSRATEALGIELPHM